MQAMIRVSMVTECFCVAQLFIGPQRKQQMIETEQLMNEVVSDAGGRRISSLLPGTMALTPENADYFFYQHCAVLELKSLQAVLLTPAYQDKLRRLASGWRDRGLIPFSTRVKLELPKLPPTCQQEWVRLLTQSLQSRVIAKANSQIKTIKKLLNVPDFKGALLLANDCASDVEPYNLFVLIANILRKTHPDGSPQYSSIDAVAFLSCNLPLTGRPKLRHPALWWFNGHRPSSTRLLSNLLVQIQSCW